MSNTGSMIEVLYQLLSRMDRLNRKEKYGDKTESKAGVIAGEKTQGAQRLA
jgi:hypothetical protein